ncbi:uncharacterized protein Dana_GF17202 [Drosophila ananassae]|uniref:Uncharacterized protein n=1 Tax=Drosophila ananassae TaxID=7217 RepID=B3M079_DROAN|nr:uncharacterized protein LOC6499989 isoform X2 [Drosophila ananassae]EDV42036.1 uncharacterized protein Dana_GF17202 [Drosophila ananassae]
MTTSDEMGMGGNFCHDHIQHPLMWCDEKKRLVERKNAEESLRMWRRRKAEECARKEKDKQEYYDLFVQHCPWGRPGGGAPNVEVRRKDITAVGLHSTPTVTTAHRMNSLQPCRYNDFFSMKNKCHNNPLAAYHHHHHHAPPPPPGGRLPHAHSVHHLQESGPRSSTVTICEREIPHKPGAGVGVGLAKNANGHVDIELRYKPSPPCKGKPILDKIVVSESEQRSCPLQEKLASQKKRLQAKLEKPPCKEPWGKAGPGGKPWRSPKEVGNTFMKSLGWTNKEMLKELDQDNPVTPAEKNTFRKSRPCKPPKPQRCCDMCTCNCPAMNGSPGKGPPPPIPPGKKCLPPPAPPKILHHLKPQDCKPIKICPRMGRGHCPGSTSTATPDVSTAGNGGGPGGEGGGVELVPLLARRRGMHRPISLSSTDVTKRTPSHDRYASKHTQKICQQAKIKCINSIIKNISHMKRLPKNLNCKLQCCSCDCPTAISKGCCLKRLTLHIRQA